jgi:hypothetical protein
MNRYIYMNESVLLNTIIFEMTIPDIRYESKGLVS